MSHGTRCVWHGRGAVARTSLSRVSASSSSWRASGSDSGEGPLPWAFVGGCGAGRRGGSGQPRARPRPPLRAFARAFARVCVPSQPRLSCITPLPSPPSVASAVLASSCAAAPLPIIRLWAPSLASAAPPAQLRLRSRTPAQPISPAAPRHGVRSQQLHLSLSRDQLLLHSCIPVPTFPCAQSPRSAYPQRHGDRAQLLRPGHAVQADGRRVRARGQRLPCARVVKAERAHDRWRAQVGQGQARGRGEGALPALRVGGRCARAARAMWVRRCGSGDVGQARAEGSPGLVGGLRGSERLIERGRHAAGRGRWGRGGAVHAQRCDVRHVREDGRKAIYPST